MAISFDDVLRESTDLVEAGLHWMDAALRRDKTSAPQDLRAAGISTGAGPATMDAAVSEFSNRIVRIAGMRASQPEDLASAWREVVDAARHCFGSVERREGELTSVEAMRSSATLVIQSLLRANASDQLVGSARLQGFADNVLELFSDNHVYVTLQYRELIAHYRERLETEPADAAARLELGRIYIKCGLYDEATSELRLASSDQKVRARALHELAVAHYRAGRFVEAVADGSASLAINPSNERTRFWVWLAAQKAGGYPAEVPADHRMDVKAGWDTSSIKLEDVAARIGMDKTSGGRGTAVFDYDGDGYLDVLIAAAHGGCSLYHNNGDGTFTDVSISSGFDTCVNGFITAVGDYDNDGRPDVFVTRQGFFGGDCALYRNNGNGTFTEVTTEAGLASWGPAFSASWIDYDGDGWLDLFVANNLGSTFERKTPNRLFHNNGDGTFTEVAEQAGLTTIWPTIGSSWGDYDNDGRPDLFLSNALGRSQLFHNNGDGTFTDVSQQAGVDAVNFGSVCFWCDYDNDGWLDLIQFAWSDHEDVVHTMRHGEGPPDGCPSRVYRNNRDGSFTDRSRELGVTGCFGTMSGNFGDLNNDGHLDFVFGNGSPRMERADALTLLESDGRQFHNVTFAAGLPYVGKSHGVNMADLDGDGRVSLIVSSGGAYPGDLLTTAVYRPTVLPGNYLNVRLVGTSSNRDAIGARVMLEAGGRRQHRLVYGGTSFGCLPFEQHFGLGACDGVDAIEIWWPSGLRQRLASLPANTTIRITEGDDRWTPVYSKKP